MRAELMTIVVSHVDNLRSSFELVNVCQGWEQSVLNRIFRVGNVAQTPQAGYIWITSASLRFGRSSYKKICARPRLICRPGYARNQVVGIVPPSIM